MIRYTLKCTDGHSFDSWFPSAEKYDTLKARGLVTCATCGSDQVDKAVMAPNVAAKGTVDAPLRKAASEVEAKLTALRQQVEANSDYVGTDFAKEARAIHDGEAPERAIYGEARPAEAKALIEDGVPVAPLPFRPTRKAN